MTLTRRGLAAASALAFLGAAGTARADAYAYAGVVFTRTTLGGLTAGGVTVDGADEATRSDAGFPGFASAGFSAGPKDAIAPLSRGSDVSQAYSGPGPTPAEDTHSPALLGGFGTRGDAWIGPSFVAGVGTRTGDVAEGRLNTAGHAASTAGTSTEFDIGVAPGQTRTLTLAVDASVGLSATATAAGESSRARVNAGFVVVGTGGTVFAPFVFSPKP